MSNEAPASCTEPVAAAIREWLQVTLTENKPGALAQVAAVSHLAHQLLTAMDDDLLLGAPRRRRGGLPVGGAYGFPPSDLGEYTEMSPMNGSGLGVVGGGPEESETFGTAALRTMFEKISDMQTTPDKLVDALVAAEAAGLKDVATALRAKLAEKFPPPVPPLEVRGI